MRQPCVSWGKMRKPFGKKRLPVCAPVPPIHPGLHGLHIGLTDRICKPVNLQPEKIIKNYKKVVDIWVQVCYNVVTQREETKRHRPWGRAAPDY